MPQTDGPGLQKLLDYCGLLSARNGLNFFYDFQLKKHARHRCGHFVPDQADYEYIASKADLFYRMQSSSEEVIRQIVDSYADVINAHQRNDIFECAIKSFADTGNINQVIGDYREILENYAQKVNATEVDGSAGTETGSANANQPQIAYARAPQKRKPHDLILKITIATAILLTIDATIYAINTTNFSRHFIAVITSNIINTTRIALLLASIYIGYSAYRYTSARSSWPAIPCGILIGVAGLIACLEGSSAIKRWGEHHIPGFAKVERERFESRLYADD